MVQSTLFKMKPPLESEIQKSILDYLKIRYHDCVWRNMVGAARIQQPNGKTNFVQFGKVGMSDIMGVIPPGGRFLAIEVKRPGGKPTQAQEEFLSMVKAAGGIAFVATSLDDVLAHGL